VRTGLRTKSDREELNHLVGQTRRLLSLLLLTPGLKGTAYGCLDPLPVERHNTAVALFDGRYANRVLHFVFVRVLVQSRGQPLLSCYGTPDAWLE
jgi:hypothetical protein